MAKDCAAYCGEEDESKTLVQLPCKHALHEECLDTLLSQRNGRCPICRSSIDSLRTVRHYHDIHVEAQQEFTRNLRQARLGSLQVFLRLPNENEQNNDETGENGSSSSTEIDQAALEAF